MPKQSDNPRIVRVLLFGAPGVGKNCLESRFTTATFPPPYDPQLTLSVRRHLTLSTPECSLSAGAPSPAAKSPSSSSSSSSSALDKPDAPFTSSEYMVEIINHPGLQRPSERLRALSHGAFDAVVIMYDVTSRPSFTAAAALHREVRHAFPVETCKRTWRIGTLRSPMPKPVVALVGNKSDLASAPPLDQQHPQDHHATLLATSPSTRQVLTHEGLELASQIGLGTAFFETSAKTGANIDCVFETVVRAVRREEVAAADVVSLSRRLSVRRSAAPQRELIGRCDGGLVRESRSGRSGDAKQLHASLKDRGGGMLKRARSLFLR